MANFIRMILAVFLLLVAAFCVYQVIAGGESSESRWAYWLLDGIIGLASLAGACWLLGRKRSDVQVTNRQAAGDSHADALEDGGGRSPRICSVAHVLGRDGRPRLVSGDDAVGCGQRPGIPRGRSVRGGSLCAAHRLER